MSDKRGQVAGATPTIYVRVHAFATSNDDGQEAAPATAESIYRSLQATNAYFAPAGIVFLFDPAKGFERIKSTLANYDSSGKPNDPHRNTTRANADRRTAIAKRHPREMVFFFRSFNNARDPQTGHFKRATGGFSGAKMNHIVTGPGAGSGPFLAHEIGHYLHLTHTFVTNVNDVKTAAEKIREHVERGHPKSAGLDALDGDRTEVKDTPADTAGMIWLSVGKEKCGPGSVAIPVKFRDGTERVYELRPDKRNIMSYFKDCTNVAHNFSPQQIDRMRHALLRGNRRGIVASLNRPPAGAVIPEATETAVSTSTAAEDPQDAVALQDHLAVNVSDYADPELHASESISLGAMVVLAGAAGVALFGAGAVALAVKRHQQKKAKSS